jgi:transposase
MRTKSPSPKAPAERVLKDIRRATRKHYSAEDKIRIVLVAPDVRFGQPDGHTF